VGEEGGRKGVGKRMVMEEEGDRWRQRGRKEKQFAFIRRPQVMRMLLIRESHSEDHCFRIDDAQETM
jgi:hypothetical protein